MKQSLYAGAGKAEITPAKSLFPIPFFMSYAFNGINDPLFVRVLDIESNERVLFITFDTTMVPAPNETMRYAIELTGLDEEHIFICATHTHCAPIVLDYAGNESTTDKDQLWYQDVKKALCQAIKDAAKTKRKAKIGLGQGKSYVNINRDEILDNGNSGIGMNFEKFSDKTLSVLKIEDLEGKPIAFLSNFAVHATVMNGCITDGGIKISADIAGSTSCLIENRYPGAVCLWTSGAAGDQNPVIGTQYTFDRATGLDGVKNLGDKGHIIVEYLANMHAHDINKTIEAISCEQKSVPIFAKKTTVKCPGKYNDNLLAFAKLQGKELPPAKDMEYILRVISLGDLAIEGISAEIVSSIGKAVREVSPYKNTILITQVDRYTGYVPDDWEYEHKAFEAEGAMVQKGVAQPAFIQGFKDLFENK